MTIKNKETGLLGETMAANYLQENGWEILDRNWQYKQWELDLVAKQNTMLIFCEVKTMEFGFVLPPTQKLGRSKFRALMQGADAWLNQRGFWGEIRFDLIYVLLHKRPAEIIHYQDVWFPNNWGR